MSPGELLELSDERDRYLSRIRAAEVHGYQRGHDDGYSAGWLDALAMVKRVEHEMVDAFNRMAVSWTVRGQRRTRATFGQPHPRDYPGGELPREHQGEVWLAGPAVHHHRCTDACRSYAPGWYPDGGAR
jgi:hypothetical protein